MVTLAGPAHVAQVGVDMLASVGLAELLASDEDVYLALGVKLDCNHDNVEQCAKLCDRAC
jgi:predicted O-linked N-acetylglucosamine transferase (SPINDLY family)